MATNFGRYGFGDEDEDVSPDIGNPGVPADRISDDQVPGMEPLEEVDAATTTEGPELPVEMDFDPLAGLGEEQSGTKDLLELRGFYVGSGSGIYDGSVRDGEEPGESFYVDLVDYETGETKRAWGVILGDVMRKAISAYNLEPGSRIHLKQQGKRQVIIDEVNSRNEMQIRQTYANGWTCLQDRGPLPSHLSHLMAGINIDAMLDRIALRHDMGLEDPRLAGWKKEQREILAAIGDDPQSVKAWLARQASLSQAEELQLVGQAVDLAGYGEGDATRRKQEIDSRMAAMSMMDAERRYDYLMQAAKPHLIASNQEVKKRLADEVVNAIEQLSVMATPKDLPDSAMRVAMRAALAQSVDGLTLQQQKDYLASRREKLLRDQLAQLRPVEPEVKKSGPLSHLDDVVVSKDVAIEARGLSQEEYRYLLQRRLDLAETDEERQVIFDSEIESQRARVDNANKNFERLDDLNRRLSHGNADITGVVAGQLVDALASYAGTKIMPAVKTTFQSLGGLSGWRKRGAELDLAELRSAFSAAKSSPVYEGFRQDPSVVATASSHGMSVDEFVAAYPQAAHTEALQAHLQAQETAASPKADSAADSKVKGLWKNSLQAASDLAQRLGSMVPEDLIKKGKIDNEWISRMQAGLSDFADEMKKTLMPENVRDGLQKLIAEIVASIQMMADLASQLLSKASPSMGR